MFVHTNLKTMKKFILLAAVLGIATATYQPAKAQVSINVNIGTPSYYAPRSYNSYYVPARTVVYPRYHQRNVVVYRPQPYVQRNSYYSNYRPATRHYSAKRFEYNKHNKSFRNERGGGHGKGRH
jgi:hypothetical protein